METDAESLRARIDALPGLEPLRDAATELEPHLVGGAVRDLILGADRADVDVLVSGHAIALARRLDPEATLHERFGTATVKLDGLTVDIAGARAEEYARPGALPDVRPGTLADDLGRRDFTVNAMAAPITGPAGLLDPHGGAGDLEAGVLRVLHDRSLSDDPTRALRAARYAARLGFSLEEETDRLVRAAELETVSDQRIESEMRKIGAEANSPRALQLLDEWGVLDLASDVPTLAERALALLDEEPWSSAGDSGALLVALVAADRARAEDLAREEPGSPSDAVALAHGEDGITLLLARAMGAEWLDSYMREWRDVRLEIGGVELMEAGVPEGPAIGRGLAAALRAKLDGGVSTREGELRIALEAAGES